MAWNIREQCTRDLKTLEYDSKYITLATATCFTLCSIKSWCTAAVESVYLVYADPVVLTGVTCAVINICL